jgi:hypothetical protein
LTGLVLAYGGATTDCTSDTFGEAISCSIDAGVQTGAGVMVLMLGVSTLIYNELRTLPPVIDEPPTALVPERRFIAHADEVRTPMTADPLLRRLTLQASIAARAGHCSVVDSVAARVADLDRRYRYSGFVSDRAIVACIDR